MAKTIKKIITYPPLVVILLTSLTFLITLYAGEDITQTAKSGVRRKLEENTHSLSRTNGADSVEDVSIYVNDYEVTHFRSSELDMSKYSQTSKPLIPHIIHQTWKNYEIPKSFVPWIKSVIKAHPNWQYWFWTDRDIECYFKSKHPDFYLKFITYPTFIHKSDIMRYFTLYDYGGFYLDLDVEVLKPLDIWTHVAQSVVSLETFEHPYIAFPERSKPNLINAVMGTMPRHGFYKLLQEKLNISFHTEPTSVIKETGPLYLDKTYRKYWKNSTNEKLTVIDPKYWFPTFDPWRATKIKKFCISRLLKPPKSLLKKICDKQVAENFKNHPGHDAFLNHHWQHSWLVDAMKDFRSSNLISIFKVIPNLVKMSDKLNMTC